MSHITHVRQVYWIYTLGRVVAGNLYCRTSSVDPTLWQTSLPATSMPIMSEGGWSLFPIETSTTQFCQFQDTMIVWSFSLAWKEIKVLLQFWDNLFVVVLPVRDTVGGNMILPNQLCYRLTIIDPLKVYTVCFHLEIMIWWLCVKIPKCLLYKMKKPLEQRPIHRIGFISSSWKYQNFYSCTVQGRETTRLITYIFFEYEMYCHTCCHTSDNTAMKGKQSVTI